MHGTAKFPGLNAINTPQPWVKMYDRFGKEVGVCRAIAEDKIEWRTDDPATFDILSQGVFRDLTIGGVEVGGA